MRSVVASFLLLGSGALLAVGSTAEAQVDSVRFGVMDHNIRVTDAKNANKESGVNVHADVRFDSPGFLKAIGSPRPYAMVSVNTDGATSFGAVGLSWEFQLAPGWRFENGFGYAVHDGELNNPFPSNTPQAVEFSRTRVLLGSRDLFRTSLGLSRDLSDDWAVQVMYEHLSHGQILGEGRNQGLDEIGLRLVYRFE